MRRDLIVRVINAVRRCSRVLLARLLTPQFANSPKRFTMKLPCDLLNPQCISIGNDVFIGPYSTLEAIIDRSGQKFTPSIRIGNRVSITGRIQLHSAGLIEIEDEVLIASNVFICDVTHGYADANVSYMDQPLPPPKAIKIKKGSWIGQNVVILPGVTIGENCIVGANSVVTRSLPDRTISVGSPAKPIRFWDAETHSWFSAAEH